MTHAPPKPIMRNRPVVVICECSDILFLLAVVLIEHLKKFRHGEEECAVIRYHGLSCGSVICKVEQKRWQFDPSTKEVFL